MLTKAQIKREARSIILSLIWKEINGSSEILGDNVVDEYSNVIYEALRVEYNRLNKQWKYPKSSLLDR